MGLRRERTWVKRSVGVEFTRVFPELHAVLAVSAQSAGGEVQQEESMHHLLARGAFELGLGSMQ